MTYKSMHPCDSCSNSYACGLQGLCKIQAQKEVAAAQDRDFVEKIKGMFPSIALPCVSCSSPTLCCKMESCFDGAFSKVEMGVGKEAREAVHPTLCPGCTSYLCIEEGTCRSRLKGDQPPAVAEVGSRFSEGKPRYDLIPPAFLKALAAHFAAGATKYGERNWEKGMPWSEYVRAAMGHLNEWCLGNNKDDPDPKLPEKYVADNLVSAAWNIICLWESQRREIGEDIPAAQFSSLPEVPTP